MKFLSSWMIPVVFLWGCSTLLLLHMHPALGKKQLLFGVLGLVAVFLMKRISYIWLIRMAPLWYIGGLILLLLVLWKGVVVHGNRAWLRLGGFSLQPAELVKIALALWLAFLMYRFKERFLWLSMITVAPIFFCIMLQPDLGSSLVIGVLWFFAAYLMVPSFRWLLYPVLAGILAFVLGWNFFFTHYQKQRIAYILYPERTAESIRYQIDQALIAMGSGQLYGKGLGKASQSRLRYLPASSTDFFFSVAGEVGGFVLILMLMLCYGWFFLGAFHMLLQHPNGEGQSLGFMLLGILLFHFLYNTFMNVGWLPVVGLPLPFFSYGGSFLVSSFIMCGILMSIDCQRFEVL